MSACASAFSHQRCVHACTVSAACEKSNLGTVRTLRCVPPSRALPSSDRLSSSRELVQLSFVDLEEKKRKKLPQTSLRTGTKATTSNVRTSKLSISACGRATNTVQAPAQSLLSVRKSEPVSRCFQHEGESPRSRKSATFFVMSCLDTLPNFTPVGSGPAYMAQQITCTRGAVGESGPAYIALCPNVEELPAGSDGKIAQPRRGIETRVSRLLVGRSNHGATMPRPEMRTNSFRLPSCQSFFFHYTVTQRSILCQRKWTELDQEFFRQKRSFHNETDGSEENGTSDRNLPE